MSRAPYPMLLMLAMSLPGAVRALGLGDIRIESALNEPLSAQIDIVGATRDELAALTASVANRDIFQRYGADRPSFLSSATFKVGLDGQGRPVLNVRSAEAFSDPLVSFIVDLRWGKNAVVREYSLLLDPPGYAAPGVAPEVRMAAVAVQPKAQPQSQPQPLSSHRQVASARRAQHKVMAGETLRAVARQAGARNESQAQRLMMAIFHANPAAFDGNINRLHRDALLSMPTEADLDAIPAAAAKREVREHMTAWRLDGRPATAHRSVAALPAAPPAPTPAPTVVAVPAADDVLKARVTSLEQSLNDMHQQLATENAKLRSLKDVVARPQAPPAELVQLPIISAARADPVAHSAAGQAPAGDKNGWIAPVVLSAGLMLGAFAYFRRRRALAAMASFEPILVPLESEMPEAAFLQDAPGIAPPPVFTAPSMPSMPSVAAPSSVSRATDPIDPLIAAAMFDLPARMADTAKNAVLAMEENDHTEKTTVSLEIDIEALERSYLDSLPEFDTALMHSELNTAIIDAKQLPESISNTSLDFDLLDLDAKSTAQHVHMPSGLHERPAVGERRMNIADVLKLAIEKDPQRSDLRMKLLETYYSAAATNQRAFIDVVRKLSREPDHLSPEDWEKVNMMGRQIAADDILFAGSSKDDDLADCA